MVQSRLSMSERVLLIVRHNNQPLVRRCRALNKSTESTIPTCTPVTSFFLGGGFFPQKEGDEALARRRAKARSPKGRERGWDSWGGSSEPTSYIGSGERCKLPQRGPGRSPGNFEPRYLSGSGRGFNPLTQSKPSCWGVETCFVTITVSVFLLSKNRDGSDCPLAPHLSIIRQQLQRHTQPNFAGRCSWASWPVSITNPAYRIS